MRGGFVQPRGAAALPPCPPRRAPGAARQDTVVLLDTHPQKYGLRWVRDCDSIPTEGGLRVRRHALASGSPQRRQQPLR